MHSSILAQAVVRATVVSMALFFAGSVVSSGAPAEFPAGVRISMDVAPELEFSIKAEGPSVLWIRAQAPNLVRLVVETEDAGVIVTGVQGEAEAVIPVTRSGKIRCRAVSSRAGGRAFVTSAYGIGPEMDVTEMVDLMTPPRIDLAPIDTRALPSASKADSSASATPVRVASETPVAPAPLIQPQLPELKRQAAFERLAFGTVASGSLVPASGFSAAVRTYRVYVPNRFPFRIRLEGRADLRVETPWSRWERTVVGDHEAKSMEIPSPDDEYYLITIRGAGPYSLGTERL